MVELWACMRDGVILVQPGALPYYWTDPETGDPHQMHALSLAERQALGWDVVEQRGYLKTLPDVRVAVEPDVNIIDGKIVYTHRYDTTVKTRGTLDDLVNQWAEEERSKMQQPRPLQVMVYIEKMLEVRRLADDPTPTNEDYPLLAASLGIEGLTLAEVAAKVQAAHTQWVSVAARIEHDRLANRKLIEGAQTDDEAIAIFNGVRGNARTPV